MARMIATTITIPARPKTIETAIRVRFSVRRDRTKNGVPMSIISVPTLSATLVQKTEVNLAALAWPGNVEIGI